MKPIAFSWSGGKDSALALYEIQKRGEYRVTELFTTVTEGYDRISMHGVRRVLLERQAVSLGLPLHKLYIPQKASNEDYERVLKDYLLEKKQEGIESAAFGDLFLEDIRQYREKFLAGIGMKGIFPLWHQETGRLVREFIASGFQAVIVCVDPKFLDGSFAGRCIDLDFLKALPPKVDPCGENGEFHSFVFDGPLFRDKIKFSLGEVLLRDHFYFCDLLPR